MDIKDKDIHKFQDVIRENSTYDFKDYSQNSLKRRLTKILLEYPNGFPDLINDLQKDGNILENIVKKITVNTTELFRDPHIWKDMINNLMPLYQNNTSINIWHPGCSTGQEVYSMMILLDQLGLLERTNIYASDINSDVIDTAKKGAYRLRFNREYIENFETVFSNNGSIENSFQPWKKYFKTDETFDKIVMQEFLRKKPEYAKMDLVKDENIFLINFDIIVCRNVIIYFNYELQNEVLELFHRNLRKKGVLILGLHESIIGPCSSIYSKKNMFYFKKLKR